MSDHVSTGGALLVGTGPMAEHYLAVLSSLDRATVVVGRSAEGCTRFEAATGKSALAGGLEALTTGFSDIEHAVVAVGPADLAEVTDDLLRAGVTSILVEKPGGLSADHLDRTARLAVAVGADVRVGYNRRFLASTRRAVELIQEDGGARIVACEFTEWPDRVIAAGHLPEVLARWFLANSTHVVDLALHLAGEPVELCCQLSGALDWHPAGSAFVGSGLTDRNVLLAYEADWCSAGRWGVEVTTKHRRLVLRPLEQLFEQLLGSIELNEVPLDETTDQGLKPGLLRQVEEFLAGDSPDLITIGQQAARVRQVYDRMVPPTTGEGR